MNYCVVISSEDAFIIFLLHPFLLLKKVVFKDSCNEEGCLVCAMTNSLRHF